MRVDETGAPCPATLGEYRDLCRAIGGEDCAAVKLLDMQIAKSKVGRDDLVVVPDSQMRLLLMPLLITKELPFAQADDPLRMWTVYYNPLDFPGKYVARLRLIRSGQPDEVTSQVFVADTLEQVRAALPPGLHCLARYPEDEPAIVEVWF